MAKAGCGSVCGRQKQEDHAFKTSMCYMKHCSTKLNHEVTRAVTMHVTTVHREI